MSITTTSTKDSYVGNGTTSTPYPITFKYLENSHLTVYVDDVAISDSYYTLTGDGSAGTGQFTTSLEYTPSQSVVVVLDVPFDQPTALQETGALPAKTLEESFDRLNMQIRRVWRKVQNTLTFSTDEGGTGSQGTADNLLGFDSSGDLTEIPNSKFCETANNLSDVDASTARTNLGVDPAGTRFALSELTDTTITNPVTRETLEWNGSAWVNTFSGATVTASDTPPSSPIDGDLWFDSATTQMFVYYNDGSSSQWVTVTSGSPSTDASSVTYTPAGTGAVSTTVETKLRESVSVKDFGAVGDGVANDRGAIAAALAAHSKVYLPAGTYKVTVDNAVSTGLYIGNAGRTLYGDGENTKIIFDVTDTGFKNLFSPAGGTFTLDSLSVEVQPVASGSMSMFQTSASGLTIKNCSLDGGVTDSGTFASKTHTCHMISLGGSGTQNDITVRDSYMTQFDFLMLKTNASTATNKNIRILNNTYFENYYSEVGGMNSPNGICEDVIVDGNRVLDGRLKALTGATGVQIPFGCASVSNIRITNNFCRGYYNEICHVEEDCENVVVSGNTFECDFDSNGSFISVLENNVANDLVIRNPRNVVISDNTMIYTGTAKEAGTYGVWVTYNGTAETAGSDVIISNNIVKNVATGFGDGGYIDDGSVFIGNTAVDCAVGFTWSNFASALSENNLSKNCDLGVKATAGGMINSHKFLGCTDNAEIGTNPLVLVNPTFMFEYFDIGAGATVNQVLVPLLSRCRIYGDAVGLFNKSGGNDSSSVNVNLSYDGTTLTDTSNYTLHGGSMTSSFSVSGTDLVYANFSASAKTDCIAQVRFNGSISLETT